MCVRVCVRALHGLLTWMQILERVAREELDVPVLKPRHIIKVPYIYMYMIPVHFFLAIAVDTQSSRTNRTILD